MSEFYSVDELLTSDNYRTTYYNLRDMSQEELQEFINEFKKESTPKNFDLYRKYYLVKNILDNPENKLASNFEKFLKIWENLELLNNEYTAGIIEYEEIMEPIFKIATEENAEKLIGILSPTISEFLANENLPEYYDHDSNIEFYKRNTSKIFSLLSKRPGMINGLPTIFNARVLETLDDDVIEQICYYYQGMEEYSLRIIDGEREADKITEISNQPYGKTKLELLNRCIKRYKDKNSTEYWTNAADRMINNLYDAQIEIDNIQEIDDEQIDKITLMLLQTTQKSEKLYLIENVDACLRNYEMTQKEICDSMINSEDFFQKKEAVVLSKFGYSLKEAQHLVDVFQDSTNGIANEYLKKHIKLISSIINIEENNQNLLEEIYQECPGFNENPNHTDIFTIERSLYSQYASQLNDSFLKIEECIPTEDPNIYETNENFAMLITVLSGIETNSNLIGDDYRKDWERPGIITKHFSSSYIREDMLGMCALKDIAYGFSNITSESLACMRTKRYCNNSQ